jgi:hypothetical protein
MFLLRLYRCGTQQGKGKQKRGKFFPGFTTVHFDFLHSGAGRAIIAQPDLF